MVVESASATTPTPVPFIKSSAGKFDDPRYVVRITGEAFDRLQIMSDGRILVGNGAIIPAAQTPADARKPTGAVAETYPRGLGANNSAVVATSGTLTLGAIPLHAGQVLSSITWFSSTTAAAGATHCWFALYSPTLGLLGVTNDDTSATPWAASTAKNLSLTTPFTVVTDGLYYLGYVVVATTPPNIVGMGLGTSVSALPPVLSGLSTAGLTTSATAPATAAALTPMAGYQYGFVS